MSETMVRKQVYLTRAQDRKVKALAERRGCTEAEVIREALVRLPDLESDDPAAILEAAGLVAPREEPGPVDLTPEELEAEHTWLASRTRPIGLAEALRRDRDKR